MADVLIARRDGVGSLGFCRASAAGLSAAWLVVCARWLTPAEFGDLAVLLALGGVLGVVADGGFGLLTNELVARTGAIPEGMLSLAVRKRLPLAVAASAVTAIAFVLVADDPSLVVVLVLSISILATACYTTCTAALRGLGELRPEAVNEVISRLFVLVVGLVALAVQPSVLAAVFVYAAADVLSALVLWATVSARRSTSRAALGPQVSYRRALPLGVTGLMGAVYNRLDVWVLALVAAPASVASYAIAFRVHEGLLIPANAAAALALRTRNRGGFPAVRRRLRHSLMLTGLASVAVLLLANPLIVTVFGESYRGAVGAIRVLALGAIPSTVVAVLAPIASVHRGTTFATWITTAAACDLGVVFVLGSIHGAVAAAWATTIAASVLAIAAYRLARGVTDDLCIRE